MKYLLVIGDGMADNPVPALNGKTPIEAAHTPIMDALSRDGELGSVINCPPGLPAGSETAILSVLGCDPARYFTGRSPMEAAALGYSLKPGDVCFRCNLASLTPGDMPYDERKILSHSAGSIAGSDAIEVVNALNADEEFASILREADMEIRPVPNFRPLAVWHGGSFSGTTFFPPHDHLGECVKGLTPQGGPNAHFFNRLMLVSNRVLEHHPVTEKRRAAGKLGCNSIWFWAEGTAPTLPSFHDRYGLNGAVISAVPLVHGIGVLSGMDMITVDGATGEIDTNFPGKRDATLECIDRYDFVCLHLEAPDECTHNGDTDGKVRSIEMLDSLLLEPILAGLRERGEDFRLMVLPDHKTLTSTRGHDADAVPYILFDSRRQSPGSGLSYSESNGLKTDKFYPSGHVLLDKLFAR